ncbi:hypothetical protein [Vibrio europaeus]
MVIWSAEAELPNNDAECTATTTEFEDKHFTRFAVVRGTHMH